MMNQFLHINRVAILCGIMMMGCVSQAVEQDPAAAALSAAETPTLPSSAEPFVQYLPRTAPTGTSHAVVVQGLPLVYTRQLLPLDRDGNLIGTAAAEKQVEQVLANLQSVLESTGSGLDQLVRVNVYALSHATAKRLLEELQKRTDASIRPVTTVVLTPLPHREALVAVDAIAIAADREQTVSRKRCEAVAGISDVADAAVLPRGGVAYLSGQPEAGGLAASAVVRSLSTLLARLKQLGLSPEHIVQLKVFLAPASSAEDALREIQRLFPDQLTPPVIFVEWIASVPVEVELIAQLPLAEAAVEPVQHYDPPEVPNSPSFSRVALVRTERQIHISGLSARQAGSGEEQARDLFDQIDMILKETGSNRQHLAKATYFVTDDDSSRGLDRARREFLDPEHPPAASKVTVHAVGTPERTLSIDMIAVGTQD